MDERERTLKEVLEGIDGLIMLAQWQLALATELRRKMERLASGGIQDDTPGDTT